LGGGVWAFRGEQFLFCLGWGFMRGFFFLRILGGDPPQGLPFPWVQPPPLLKKGGGGRRGTQNLACGGGWVGAFTPPFFFPPQPPKWGGPPLLACFGLGGGVNSGFPWMSFPPNGLSPFCPTSPFHMVVGQKHVFFLVWPWGPGWICRGGACFGSWWRGGSPS